jgi:vacuolar-type H+-ATPase subunit C/Vma6
MDAIHLHDGTLDRYRVRKILDERLHRYYDKIREETPGEFMDLLKRLALQHESRNIPNDA